MEAPGNGLLRQVIALRSFWVFFNEQKDPSCLCLSSMKVPLNPKVNKLRIKKKKNLSRLVAVSSSQPMLALKPRITWNPTWKKN